MIYLSFYGNNPIGNLNVMSGVAKRDKATLTCKGIEQIAWPKPSIDEALSEFELAVSSHFEWSMSNHLCRLHSPAV